VTLLRSGDAYIVDDPDIRLNPALLGDLLEAEIADSLREMNIKFTYDGIEHATTHLADLLAIPKARLDSDQLETDAPKTPGIHNIASVIAADASNAATANLLSDLRDIQRRDDWKQSAASMMIGSEKTHQVTRTTTPVEALELSEAQRAALQLIHSGQNLVLTGPPGTGKTRVVAAIVAACWAEGLSVVVASTNNTAVDNAIETTDAITEGLLVRVGNSEARKLVATRVDATVHLTERRLAVLVGQPEKHRRPQCKCRAAQAPSRPSRCCANELRRRLRKTFNARSPNHSIGSARSRAPRIATHAQRARPNHLG
jgi:AAA domain